MSLLTQTLWENNQLFGGVDGVVYQDKIIELEYRATINNSRCCKSFVLGEITIEEEFKAYPNPYIEVLPNGLVESMPDPNNILEIDVGIMPYNNPIPYQNGHIYFGEGSMGNEGFVAFIGENNQYI